MIVFRTRDKKKREREGGGKVQKLGTCTVRIRTYTYRGSWRSGEGASRVLVGSLEALCSSEKGMGFLQGWEFAHSLIPHLLICSDCSDQMSNCEQFTQIAQDKWDTVRKELRLLIRVEWFLKKYLGTCHVVVDCYGTPNPKFYFDLLLFHLAQGLKRPQKMLPVTLKSAHTKCFRSKTVFAIFEK